MKLLVLFVITRSIIICNEIALMLIAVVRYDFASYASNDQDNEFFRIVLGDRALDIRRDLAIKIAMICGNISGLCLLFHAVSSLVGTGTSICWVRSCAM